MILGKFYFTAYWSLKQHSYVLGKKNQQSEKGENSLVDFLMNGLSF